METNTEQTPRTTVNLRDLGQAVCLQLPTNQIQLADGTWSWVELGRMTHRDAAAMALAQAGAFLDHHRKQWLASERLTSREAESIPHTNLVTDVMVESVAMAMTEGWCQESLALQRARRAGIRKCIETFLEEISRG